MKTILMGLIILMSPGLLVAQSVAVIPVHAGNDSLDAIADESASHAEKCFEHLGRFTPLSDQQILKFRKTIETKSETDLTAQKISEITGTDRTFLIVVFTEGSKTSLTIHMIKKGEELSQKITLRTKIPSLIPLLVVREIIAMHEKIPLEVTVRKIYENGNMLIDAGDFNLLQQNASYPINGGGLLRIVTSGRFESIATSDRKFNNGQKIELTVFPEISSEKEQNEKAIHHEIVKQYGAEFTIQKGIPDPEKRFVEGVLVVSMGGSLILPAYGSFLSTYYMGFNNPEPAYSGLILSASLEAGSLFSIPLKTDKSNWRSYLPIKNDSKSEKELRLQQYLWWTIPVTFAVTYCDQLSYQYDFRRVLPPLFDNPDRTAAILSVAIPGGGLFYKGYREIGWGYYLTEFALGGYAAFNKGKRTSHRALIALGGIKCIEVMSAAILSPSYRFYRDEYDRPYVPKLSLAIIPDDTKKASITAGVTFSF
ncbi:MAG TPA: hypothetical protein VF857_11465 [Spirochaetota bacterium]